MLIMFNTQKYFKLKSFFKKKILVIVDELYKFYFEINKNYLMTSQN
jgi:hypothetical protein